MPPAKPSRHAVANYRTRGARVDAVNPGQAHSLLLDSRGHRHLTQRVYGPGLMLATLDTGRQVGLRHYLYGGSADVLNELAHRLRVQFGTPRQDAWVDAERDEIPATLVAIGTAFDFLAGAKRQAPRWMHDAGLEWSFRLGTEPRRLWRRYVVGNAVLLAGVATDALRSRRRR